MTDAGEILEWGSIDPYYVWAEASDFLGMPPADDDWIPVLVEARTVPTAVLRRLLADTFEDDVLLPLDRDGRTAFTLYVQKSRLKELLALLCSKSGGARWELGLPVKSPTALPSVVKAMEIRPRPRSEKGVVGFIDYGCAFAHQQFRVWDGDAAAVPPDAERKRETRVLALWDQGGSSLDNRAPALNAGRHPPKWITPSDFHYGAEWRRDSVAHDEEAELSADGKLALNINDYIKQFASDGSVDEQGCYAYSGYRAIQAAVTHGTFVMDLAAGYPNPLLAPGGNAGLPLVEDIVFVQLPRYFGGAEVTGVLRTYVLDAVDYIFSCAEEKVPVTINLSYGAYAGPHDGKTILEAALDAAIQARRAAGGPTDIVIAAGNGADSETHAEVLLNGVTPGEEAPSVELVWNTIPNDPTDQFIEIWFNGVADGCDVRVTQPQAEPAEGDWVSRGTFREIRRGKAMIGMVIAPRTVAQHDGRRMVLVAVAPTATGEGRAAAPYGDWTLELRNRDGADVVAKAWIERDDPVFMSAGGPRQTRFKHAGITTSESLNNIGTGTEPLVIGGFIGGSDRVPVYSAKAQARSNAAGQPIPSWNNGRPGPEWLAICEESEAQGGLSAAKVIGTGRVRLPGTSAATAVATRYVVARRAVTSGTGKVKPPDTRGAGEWELPRVP